MMEILNISCHDIAKLAADAWLWFLGKDPLMKKKVHSAMKGLQTAVTLTLEARRDIKHEQ